MRQYRNGQLHDMPQAPIWRKPEKSRNRIIHAVCRRLSAAFGKPRLGNPRGPMDDLIFLMLSNRTQFETAKFVFNSLKEIGSWDSVAQLPSIELERRIQVPLQAEGYRLSSVIDFSAWRFRNSSSGAKLFGRFSSEPSKLVSHCIVSFAVPTDSFSRVENRMMKPFSIHIRCRSKARS